QLLQPFISIVAGFLILGEGFEALTLGFAFAVVFTVFLGRRFTLPPSAPTPPASASPAAPNPP
ncbi:MAG: hypothetical protein WCG92_16475, partial [Hyphomicrobiales bacterium]